MDKALAVATVLDAVPHAPAVFTTGYTARIGAAFEGRPGRFCMTGSMGLALPIGTGIALASGLLTVVIDGDGAVLMNPAALLAAANHPGLPLLHVVLDDGRYASTGGQPTGSDLVDLEALARASGVARAWTVDDVTGLRDRLREYLQGPAGPGFVRCLLSGPEPPPPPRIQVPLAAHARRFADDVRALRDGGAAG